MTREEGGVLGEFGKGGGLGCWVSMTREEGEELG